MFFVLGIKIGDLVSESLLFPLIAIGLAILVSLLHTIYMYSSEMKDDEFMNKLKRKSAYHALAITRFILIGSLILMGFSYRINVKTLLIFLLIVPTGIQVITEIYFKKNPEKV